MARSARAGVEIREGATDHEWNDLVRRSPHATVFHREECLDAIAAHSGATLHRLVGVHDGDPVGLLPAFEHSKGPVAAVFSPPPGMGLPGLGPVLVGGDCDPGLPGDTSATASAPGGGPERRLAAAFLRAASRRIRRTVGPSYVHIVTAGGFADLHPFALDEAYQTTPQFTYVVDLVGDSDDLLASFSSDARGNVRQARDAPVAVREGGRDAIGTVLAQLRDRYAEQGLSYPVAPAFVADLYDRLPDGTVRPYVCTVDGDYVGGMVTLADADTVYRWQGGARTDDDLPVNDYLDWRIMRDAAARGQARYDLVGANMPGLCEYKAKFNPELQTYFRVERGTTGMGLVAGLYRRLRDMGFAPKGGSR